MTELSRILFFGLIAYVGLLLTLGALGRRAKVSHTLSDHFLANRSIGLFVLLFTLFATQYSGNSFVAFPGKTYRAGLAYFMSVTFMVAIVAGYTLFAPKLFALSRRRSYLTPTDYLVDRFRSPLLAQASAVIFILTLCNYLLAQLMAMGRAVNGITEGHVPYATGVIVGAAVILVYELLGGMRAVAWTDALQGVLMTLGLAACVALIIAVVGTPAEVLATIAEREPAKVDPPDARTCVTWLSSFLLLGLGAPLYPQAIQRIYAARGLPQLRRALAIMAFLPLVAITTVIFLGVTGLALFPGLEKGESDGVTFLVLAHLVESHPLAWVPVVIVMLGVTAAIMSTADSALLSLASIFTKDITARVMRLSEKESERLTRAAPLYSVIVTVALVTVALLVGRGLTLWRLLELKFELLIQLSPAYVLGTLHDGDEPRAFSAGDVLAGIGAGLALALGMHVWGIKSAGGLHPGVAGVVLNYVVVLVSREARLRFARREA